MSDLPTPEYLLPPPPNAASVRNEFKISFDQLQGKKRSAVLPGDVGAGAAGSTFGSVQADASSAPQGQPALPYGSVQRWSVLLETVPSVHRIKLLRELPGAIARGEVQAVSLNTELTHEYQNKDGQPETHTAPDEAIWYTADLQKWMVHHVKEHVYELLAEQDRLRVDFDLIASGELDFKRLVKMRQGAAPVSSKPTGKSGDKPAGKSSGKKTPAVSSKTPTPPKRDHQKAEAPTS
ncbi:hypothetical protein [Deinococcus aquatilis]|uniref:hypothetical protein n=1 Tax=Deinococcus aquatilis TaxID=519440 RepID=UPI00037BFE23|nr:hypothetical protein [Deinococcus aquatilis]